MFNLGLELMLLKMGQSVIYYLLNFQFLILIMYCNVQCIICECLILFMDIEVFSFIDIRINEIISGVRVCNVQIIDEQYGVYVFEIVYLGFILISFGVEGCVISCSCILVSIGWVSGFYVVI